MACIKPPKLLTAGQPFEAVTAALFAGNHHVFDPQVKVGKTGEPYIVGGHHLKEFDLSSVNEAVIDVATGSARYHLNLDHQGKPVEANKSMFDQGKSRQEIKEMVVEVLRMPSSINIKSNGRRVVDGESQGISIRLVIEPDGTLVTAFPVIPGPKDYTKEGGRMELRGERAARLANLRRSR